jgi:hypothetical protein
MTKKKSSSIPIIKTCPVDPRHFWIADIPYCPYCAFTSQQRADWMNRQKQNLKPTKKEKIWK